VDFGSVTVDTVCVGRVRDRERVPRISV